MSLPEAQINKLEIKELVAHKWDLASETFDTHAGHGIQSEREREAWKRTFLRILPEKGLKILDVGCGTGELSILLAEMGHKVTGIDISKKMLEIAKEKAEACGLDLIFEEGDAEHPPFDVASFDVVFNRHLLWTLPDPESAVTNWRKVLRNGGMVVIIDGVWDDGTLSSRARRIASALATLLVERRDPRKGHCGYSEELKARLPHAGGAPLEKVREYLATKGFEEVRDFDLGEILEIQKQTMPFRERVTLNYHYYLVQGLK